MNDSLADGIAAKRREIEAGGYCLWKYRDDAPPFPIDPRAPRSRGAEMRMSVELLTDLLRLPDGSKIYGASFDEATRCVVLRVAHPAIASSRVSPRYHKEWSDARISFVDWGEDRDAQAADIECVRTW